MKAWLLLLTLLLAGCSSSKDSDAPEVTDAPETTPRISSNDDVPPDRDYLQEWNGTLAAATCVSAGSGCTGMYSGGDNWHTWTAPLNATHWRLRVQWVANSPETERLQVTVWGDDRTIADVTDISPIEIDAEATEDSLDLRVLVPGGTGVQHHEEQHFSTRATFTTPAGS